MFDLLLNLRFNLCFFVHILFSSPVYCFMFWLYVPSLFSSCQSFNLFMFSDMLSDLLSILWCSYPVQLLDLLSLFWLFYPVPLFCMFFLPSFLCLSFSFSSWKISRGFKRIQEKKTALGMVFPLVLSPLLVVCRRLISVVCPHCSVYSLFWLPDSVMLSSFSTSWRSDGLTLLAVVVYFPVSDGFLCGGGVSAARCLAWIMYMWLGWSVSLSSFSHCAVSRAARFPVSFPVGFLLAVLVVVSCWFYLLGYSVGLYSPRIFLFMI